MRSLVESLGSIIDEVERIRSDDPRRTPMSQQRLDKEEHVRVSGLATSTMTHSIPVLLVL
jgi:hypothetical protein